MVSNVWALFLIAARPVDTVCVPKSPLARHPSLGPPLKHQDEHHIPRKSGDEHGCVLQVDSRAVFLGTHNRFGTQRTRKLRLHSKESETRDVATKGLDLSPGNKPAISGSVKTWGWLMLAFCLGAFAIGVGVCLYYYPLAGAPTDSNRMTGPRTTNRMSRIPVQTGTAITDHHKQLQPPSTKKLDCESGHVIVSRIVHEDGSKEYPEGRSTQYCVVAHDAVENDLMLNLFETIIHCPEWDLPIPKLILSIMGGAADFKVDESNFKLAQFCEMLLDLARQANAWVITGGTNCGVMKVIGEAMKKHDRFRELPCIGVTPFGALQSRWRELLMEGSTHEFVNATSLLEYVAGPDDAKLAELEPNHTHSILCDSGDVGVGAFGKEEGFRAAFDKCASMHVMHMGEQAGKDLMVPRVMILVNGGPISLKQCLWAIQQGCPVVVCKNTGRAADAIAASVEIMEDKGWTKEFKEVALETARTHLTMKCEEEEDLKLITEGRKIVIHSAKKQPLSKSILQAVLLQDGPVKVEDQLSLAVQWRCQDFYPKLGERLFEESPDAAIKWVLLNLVRGTDVQANLMALPLGGMGHGRVEQRSRDLGVIPIIKWILDNHLQELERFNMLANRLHINFEGLGWGESWRHKEEGIFVWSIENGALMSVVDEFLLHLKEPVHSALVGAAVCRATAKSIYDTGTYNGKLEGQRLTDMADHCEKAAVRLVEELAHLAGVSPVEYISRSSNRWASADGSDPRNCFFLSNHLGCKIFSSATFYRIAVDTYFATPPPFEQNFAAQRHLDYRYTNILRLASIFLGFVDTEEATCGEAMPLSKWQILSVPQVKVYTHCFSRLCFITIYVLSVFEGHLQDGAISLGALMLFFWGLGYGLEEFQQYRRMESIHQYIRDPWNVMDALQVTVLLGALAAGWILTDHTSNITMIESMLEQLHAWNLIPVIVRILQFFQLSEYFGVLLLTVVSMVKDTGYFFLLLFIFCFTFSCALTPILWPTLDERLRQGLTWSLWSMYGPNRDALEQADKLDSQLERNFMKMLLYLLSLLSNVLLANLLIAMINNTYTNFQTSSQLEWNFFRLNIVLEFGEITAAPPPLNLVENIIALLRPSGSDHVVPLHAQKRPVAYLYPEEDMREAKSKAFEEVLAEEGGATPTPSNIHTKRFRTY